MSDSKSGSDYHGFNTTLWTVVLEAGGSKSPEAESALEQLCSAYWKPLYSYAYSKTRNPEEAEDVTQAFFTELLERKDVRQVSPEKGRFRAYLLAAMKNFLSKHWAHKNALKRGGRQPIMSLDELTEHQRVELEDDGAHAPDTRFDAQWARVLVDNVFQQLRREMSAGNAERYEALSRYVLGEVEDGAYAETAASLGLSESAVRSAVMRIRQRFRALFHDAVRQTVSDAEDVEDEMRHLLAAIS